MSVCYKDGYEAIVFLNALIKTWEELVGEKDTEVVKDIRKVIKTIENLQAENDGFHYGSV